MSYLQIFSEWSNWAWRLAFNHLWQATLFFAIALLASRMLRRGPARARYLVWLAASIKLAVPSAIILLVLSGAGVKIQSVIESSRKGAPTLEYIAPVVSPVVIPADYFNNSPVQSPRSFGQQFSTAQNVSPVLMALTVVWLAGAAFFAVGWLKRRRKVASSIAAGHRLLAGREREALTKVTTWLGITRHIDLIVTPEVKEPGVWGVFSPVVLLPETICSQLSDEELETLMMHEMAHVRRWDNLVSNFNMFLCCLFWFNPIVWFIDSWLLKEREEACDEDVLRWSGAGEAYASSIRKIYRLCLTARISGLSAAGGSKLKYRLERIVENRTGKGFSLPQRLLVAAVIVGSITLSLIGGMPPAEEVMARTNSVLQRASTNLVEQIVPGDKQDCLEPDGRKCVAPGEVVTADKGFGNVVVQSDLNGPLETGTAAITRLGGEQVSSVAASKPVPLFQSAHPVDLKKFVGRYAVDPSMMENFVFDVSLEGGDLWLKPSHAKKHKLVPQSSVDFLDSESVDTRVSFVLDSNGNVEGLKIAGWGETIAAPRLVLPPPSREGNVTFKLSGFADARIVAVAGTFNGWNQSQYLFERVGNEWICRLSLPAGKYQYKFIVDGNWLVDPTNPTVVRDEREFENSLLVVR